MIRVALLVWYLLSSIGAFSAYSVLLESDPDEAPVPNWYVVLFALLWPGTLLVLGVVFSWWYVMVRERKP